MLREFREDAGLTQRDLAETLHRPQKWVSYCETANRRVDIVEFVEWCQACGVEPTDGFQRLLKELER